MFLLNKSSQTTYKRLEDIAQSLINWNDGMRCRHFSFIISKKKIVAIGTNQRKTHPTNLKNRKISYITGEDFSDQKHVCSEFNAVLKLKNMTNIDTKKCTLVNLRYDRNRQLALARPCMSCVSLLKYFEFKRVIWTNNDGSYVSS
jgi:deoxycytidylate deaminase